MRGPDDACIALWAPKLGSGEASGHETQARAGTKYGLATSSVDVRTVAELHGFASPDAAVHGEREQAVRRPDPLMDSLTEDEGLQRGLLPAAAVTP